ncbi:MAG: BlaI/MecI/CopY family transcriptional regulator [Lachnospiraceae bacterium]|nr:BlaI/MecI/CopY family transcriptional regulator [Lachnospiraceae bacterium]
MILKYMLSDTEAEIMEVLWEKKEFIKTHDLLDLFNERGKNWKRQTLNTFLIRLEEMNLVTRDRSVVKASGTRAEYQRLQSREILDGLYGGDMGSFCMALAGKEYISEEDKKELQVLFKKMLTE